MLTILALLALASPPATAAPGAKATEQLVCRKDVATGTRIGRKKICAPRKVMDDLREEHLEASGRRGGEAQSLRPCTSLPCRG
jgi:hypothetical protein